MFCSGAPCACAPKCFGTQVWAYIFDLETYLVLVFSTAIKAYPTGYL